ncbi:MAG: cupin [Ignavibacterium sp.]|nr:cupin [Ignavibacterium sp.]MDW8374237.1 cupin [Ignavibacteriales bacterium]
MIKFIEEPSIIPSSGNKPKIIEEFFGRVNSNSDKISIAKMKSPKGWIEPPQQPEFDEYTLVIKGKLKVETKEGIFEVNQNQAILIGKGEWVRYSTPYEGGAEYIAICIPAFSTETVNRIED